MCIRDSISDDALLWLVLPPAWTAPLAAWCDFPAGKQPVQSLFESAVRNGLALSDAPVAAAPTTTPPPPSPVSDLRSPISDQPVSSAPTRKSPDLSGYDAEMLADLGLAPAAAAVAPTFWAASGTRSDILTRILADRARGQRVVREAACLIGERMHCLLYTSPSPRDRTRSRMPSSA